MASLKFDQVGLSAGVAGIARNDGLSTGAVVTLTDTTPGGTTLFEILWINPADTTSVASLAATGDSHVWKFTPTVGVRGPIRIRLTHTTSLGVITNQVRIFGIPETSGIVKLAAGEQSDPGATLANSTDPAVIDRCERNWPTTAFPAGNPFGWGADLIALIDAISVGAGTGDVVGPGSATDNAIARFDTTTGKLIQSSLVTISDTGNIMLPSGQTVDGVDIDVTIASLLSTAPTAGEYAALAGTSGTPGSGNKYVTDSDSRLSGGGAPLAHHTTHQNGGSDEVATATAAANAIPKAGAGGTLDIGWLPTGSTSTTVAIGNDSRLSDSRAPNGSASGDLAGSYPSPTVAAIHETSGPTKLTIGAVADATTGHTQALTRSGSTLVGTDVLTRAGAGEFASMTQKTTPVAADLISIEDSAASNAKKYITVGSLPVAFPTPTNFAWSSNAASINVANGGDFASTNTMGGNSTLTLTGGVDGSQGCIYVKQDGTGGRTLTLSIAGRTILRDANSTDDNPESTASSLTVLNYHYVTIVSVAYVRVTKVFL